MGNNDHIPTETVKKDIKDTQMEIDNLEDENTILLRNPIENKVRIYLNGEKSQKENAL